MYDNLIIKKATTLRKRGWSILQIAQKCCVSKATAYNWTKDVLLTEQQKKRLKQNSHSSKASKVHADNCRVQRETFQVVGHEMAKQVHDIDYVMGCALYWAEGDKAKNRVGFTNSDINMCVVFVNFLKVYFDVSNEKFQLSFQYHNDSAKSEKEIFQFWIEKLDLQGCVQHKPYQKQGKSSATKHENGIVRITVNSTEIVNKIWGSIQCFGNFSNKNALK